MTGSGAGASLEIPVTGFLLSSFVAKNAFSPNVAH